MSSLRNIVLLPVIEEAKTRDFHFFRSMYNKTVIRFGSVSADNPSLDLDYFGYHKNLIHPRRITSKKPYPTQE